MSSTYSTANFPGHDFSAAMCTDGNTGSATGAWNFCMSTYNEANPQITLQLPQGSTVSQVKVWARADCCQRFLGTFEVWVKDRPTTSEWIRCGQLATTAEAGPHTVTCSTALAGSEVQVLLPGTQRFLALAEVTAYGTVGETTPTAAPTPAVPTPVTTAPTAAPAPRELSALSASMSSTYSTANFPGHDFSAAMCIDGNTGSATGAWNFCMSTYGEASPWLSLQLPQGSTVSQVKVWARADCCQRFLGTLQVWVGSRPGAPNVGMTQCGQLTTTAEAGPHTVTCSTALRGSTVTVLLPGTQRFLVLAEVTAYGIP